ncbi:hypothetical protein K474DRAFT_1678281 [Panus rudis PR-1116 ss-1]|nr:hypothetical protein K474DRAFT_1678281 [Panus rudis PR-1116 ss-1]
MEDVGSGRPYSSVHVLREWIVSRDSGREVDEMNIQIPLWRSKGGLVPPNTWVPVNSSAEETRLPRRSNPVFFKPYADLRRFARRFPDPAEAITVSDARKRQEGRKRSIAYSTTSLTIVALRNMTYPEIERTLQARDWKICERTQEKLRAKHPYSV